MATDKEIIEDYFFKYQDGMWVLTVDEICTLHKTSKAGIYKILKRNSLLPRDRQKIVDIEDAFRNLERAIKLCKKSINQAFGKKIE